MVKRLAPADRRAGGWRDSARRSPPPSLARVYSGPLLTRLLLGAAMASVLAQRRHPPPAVLAGRAAVGPRPDRLHRGRGAGGGPPRRPARRACRGDASTPPATVFPGCSPRMIPVKPQPDTVLVPVVATWLAGLAGAEVALRTGRVLLGYLRRRCSTAARSTWSARTPDRPLWPTWPSPPSRRSGSPSPAGEPAAPPAPPPAPPARAAPRPRVCGWRRRPAAGRVAVVAAVVAGSAPVRGRAGRPGARWTRVGTSQPPQVETLDENPLIRISGWALNPDQKLLDVTTRLDAPTDPAGTAPGRRPRPRRGDCRRATAPATARTRGAAPAGGAQRLRRGDLAGRRDLPQRRAGPAAGTGRPGREPCDTVRQEITVAELTGRLLPAVATPQRVDGARVAYDPASGTLIRPEGLTPGLRYTVTSARGAPGRRTCWPPPTCRPATEVARVLRVADGGAGADAPARRAARRGERRPVRAGAGHRAVPRRALPAGGRRAERARVPEPAFFLFGPAQRPAASGAPPSSSPPRSRCWAGCSGCPPGWWSASAPGRAAARSGPATRCAWPEVLFDGVGWVPFDPLPRPDDRAPPGGGGVPARRRRATRPRPRCREPTLAPPPPTAGGAGPRRPPRRQRAGCLRRCWRRAGRAAGRRAAGGGRWPCAAGCAGDRLTAGRPRPADRRRLAGSRPTRCGWPAPGRPTTWRHRGGRAGPAALWPTGHRGRQRQRPPGPAAEAAAGSGAVVCTSWRSWSTRRPSPRARPRRAGPAGRAARARVHLRRCGRPAPGGGGCSGRVHPGPLRYPGATDRPRPGPAARGSAACRAARVVGQSRWSRPERRAGRTGAPAAVRSRRTSRAQAGLPAVRVLGPARGRRRRPPGAAGSGNAPRPARRPPRRRPGRG